MKPKERRAYILETIREKGYVSVEKLSKQFCVSMQIVRKDINKLAQEGLVKRVYGGAQMPVSRENISYDSRKVIHYEEKKEIAKLVAKQIPDNSSLFFSIGTTPEIVATELRDHKNLKIFTNNLHVALSCCQNETFEITILGGKIRNKHKDIFNRDVESFFSSFRVDFGIFGVGAIQKDGTLLDFSEDELLVRETIKKSSRKTILVADNSKFSRKAFVKGGNITEVDYFVTDKIPPKEIVELFRDSLVSVVYPKRNSYE